MLISTEHVSSFIRGNEPTLKPFVQARLHVSAFREKAGKSLIGITAGAPIRFFSSQFSTRRNKALARCVSIACAYKGCRFAWQC
jgi:hypothetical protein